MQCISHFHCRLKDEGFGRKRRNLIVVLTALLQLEAILLQVVAAKSPGL